MGDFAKIAGWTILGAVVVKLASMGTTSSVITSLTTGWANIVSSITGGTPRPQG